MSTIAAVTPWRIEFERGAQLKAAAVTVSFVLVFIYVIRDLMHEWINSSDWSHGWIIPFFSIYLVYTRWERIRRMPIRHTWVGLALIVVSLAAYQYSLWGMQIGYIRPVAMLLCLLGIIVYLCGLPVLRHAAIPWLYLFFAVPLPKGVYFTLTDPLRRIAAIVATWVLSLFPSLDIERVGSNIEYFYQGVSGQIGVADACSGMRSTITLCALGVAVAFMSERPLWHRLVMVGACIPFAVFSNFIRVTTTCYLHIFVDPRYAKGTYHMLLGLFTLVVALGMFSALGWLLSNLTVEADESEENREPATNA